MKLFLAFLFTILLSNTITPSAARQTFPEETMPEKSKQRQLILQTHSIDLLKTIQQHTQQTPLSTTQLKDLDITQLEGINWAPLYKKTDRALAALDKNDICGTCSNIEFLEEYYGTLYSWEMFAHLHMLFSGYA